jgi:hypothetical protein
MMHTMADTYSGLGLFQRAESLRNALDIRQRVFGPRHRETLRTSSVLATDVFMQRRFAEAERMLRKRLKA